MAHRIMPSNGLRHCLRVENSAAKCAAVEPSPPGLFGGIMYPIWDISPTVGPDWRKKFGQKLGEWIPDRKSQTALLAV